MQELIYTYQPHHGHEYLGGSGQLFHARICRCQTNHRVLRILAIREGRARRSQNHARFLALCHDILRTSFHRLEGNEIATERIDPGADTARADLLREQLLEHLEFRADDVRVLCHMRIDAINILEIPRMAQLLDLVETDGLDLHLLQDILLVRLGGCHCGNAGTWERNLARGAELKNHILVAELLGLFENV